MISSLANPKIKHIRRLQKDRRFRNREQEFVIEGTRMLRELCDHAQDIKTVYFTEDWVAEPGNLAFLEEQQLVNIPVSREVMAAMSAAETAPGILALAGMKAFPLPEQKAFVLVIDAVATPGNLGSLLRSAAAAAVDAVLLAPGCVDVYNPKVLRGAMGAHFRLAVRHMSWPDIADYCQPLRTWTAEAQGAKVYTEVDWRQPSALVVGNEARGISNEGHALADGSIMIPMARATESLNVTSAATVILFEAYRQKGFPNKES